MVRPVWAYLQTGCWWMMFVSLSVCLWFGDARAEGLYFDPDDIPLGFENVDAPRTTEVEIWYGGRKRGTALARFTSQWVSFQHPAKVTRLFPGLADPSAVTAALTGELSANAQLICREGRQQECGFLEPESVGVIFDARQFQADIFIAPHLLSVKTLNSSRYLSEASSHFSAMQGLSLSVSGARSKDSTDHFSWYGRSLIALRESHLFADWNYDKTEHFNIASLYAERDWQGQELVGGLFRGNSFGLGFSADPQLLGVRLAHSTESMNSEVAINSTPLLVYLPVRGRVEIYRDGKLLDARLLEAGRQELDTRGFPQGAYNLTIKVYDGTRLLDERRQLYVKSNSLPGKDDPFYFFELGRPVHNVAEQWWPEAGEGWVVRGGYSRLLLDSTSITLAGTVDNSDALIETEFLHLGEYFEVAAGMMAARHNRIGFYGNAIVFANNVQMQGRYRELSPQKNQSRGHLLGEGVRAGQLSLGASIGPVNFELGRDWRREERDHNTRVTDHLRAEWTLLRDSRLEFRMAVDASRSQGQGEKTSQILASFTLSHRSGSRELNFQQIRQENRSSGRQELSLGSRASVRWQGIEMGGRDITAGGYIEHQRQQQSAGGDARIIGRWLGGQVAVNKIMPARGEDVTNYIGSLSTSVLARMDNIAIGGGRLSDSAVVVELNGDGGGLFDILVNGKTVAHGRAGDSVPVVLAPFRKYYVSIAAAVDNFSDFDDRTHSVTLYPGNVGRLTFSITQVAPVLGRLVGDDGQPLVDAFIVNSQDLAVTDNHGLFQGRLKPAVKELQVRRSDESFCWARLPEEPRKRRGVLLLGALQCSERLESLEE